METSTIALICLTIFGWGASMVFDKLAVNAIGPKTIFIVYFTAGAITFSYFLLSGKMAPFKPFSGVVFAIISGALVAIGGIGFYTALQKEQASLAVPFVALYPAIAVVLSIIFLHEKIKLVNTAGIVLALIAGVLLAL